MSQRRRSQDSDSQKKKREVKAKCKPDCPGRVKPEETRERTSISPESITFEDEDDKYKIVCARFEKPLPSLRCPPPRVVRISCPRRFNNTAVCTQTSIVTITPCDTCDPIVIGQGPGGTKTDVKIELHIHQKSDKTNNETDEECPQICSTNQRRKSGEIENGTGAEQKESEEPSPGEDVLEAAGPSKIMSQNLDGQKSGKSSKTSQQVVEETGDNADTASGKAPSMGSVLFEANQDTQSGSAKLPETETTAEEIPAEEIPAEETPAEETPAEESPAEETPAEETPAEETPAEETPAEETPAEETPAEETPAEETPAEVEGIELAEQPESAPAEPEPQLEAGAGSRTSNLSKRSKSRESQNRASFSSKLAVEEAVARKSAGQLESAPPGRIQSSNDAGMEPQVAAARESSGGVIIKCNTGECRKQAGMSFSSKLKMDEDIRPKSEGRIEGVPPTASRLVRIPKGIEKNDVSTDTDEDLANLSYIEVEMVDVAVQVETS